MSKSFKTAPESARGHLRDDEIALDEKASLVDTVTDIDYRDAAALIWRCLMLLRFFWQRWATVLFLGWVGQAVTIALSPWLGKFLVDHVVLDQPLPANGEGYPWFLLPILEFLRGASVETMLGWLTLGLLVGVLVRVAWFYVHDLIQARLEHAQQHLVRSQLFENMQCLPFSKVDDQPIGDSVFRTMQDVRAVPEVIRIVIQESGAALVAVIVAVTTLLSAYPDSALTVFLAVGSLPIYVLVTAPFARMIRRRAQANAAAGTVFVSTTEEGMDNVLAIQSVGANEIEKTRFAAASANAFKRTRVMVLTEQAVAKLGEVSAKLLYWVFLLYVLARVISGNLSAGDYVVLVGYFLAMSEPANVFASTWILLRTPTAQARRVFAMLDMTKEQDLGKQAIPSISQGVRFEGVEYVYPNGRRVLTDVSFEAKLGALTAFVGPTGAGKTSLAHLIPRYHTVTMGRVLIDEINVNDIEVESLRSQITYIFQESVFSAETVADNIRVGKPEAALAEIEEVAKIVGLHDFITALPDGYDTKLGTTTSNLSVGHKQRLAIARGLIRNTPVLILDEPTSALDPVSEKQIVELLKALSTTRVVIVIAHRLSTIREADLIIFLDNGMLREQGNHAQLMARQDGHYRRFLEKQRG
ncbi:MAG: ATP-binding cassette domain-containing protein, partial [Proteobacteria bacterium]|nr:ATP-binding cassette domain-containing protein [Pseudomonadota bacterium]